AGDTTACSRVLNGHASWLSPCGSFHHQFARGVIGSQQSTGQLSGGGSRKRHLMSALGQKRTWPHVRSMSALPPKADIGTQSWNVRFVPKADISSEASNHLGPSSQG